MSLGTMEQRTEGMKRQAHELIEQAYQRGYKAGQESDKDIFISGILEQGRNEAWEAAKKIILSVDKGGLPADEIEKIFGIDYCYDAITKFSSFEAIEKIRAYEEQKNQEEDNEIHAGDEVEIDGIKIIVLNINGNYFEGVGCDGVYSRREKRLWKKTGRTFPEIAEVLKKLQEGE